VYSEQNVFRCPVRRNGVAPSVGLDLAIPELRERRWKSSYNRGCSIHGAGRVRMVGEWLKRNVKPWNGWSKTLPLQSSGPKEVRSSCTMRQRAQPVWAEAKSCEVIVVAKGILPGLIAAVEGTVLEPSAGWLVCLEGTKSMLITSSDKSRQDSDGTGRFVLQSHDGEG